MYCGFSVTTPDTGSVKMASTESTTRRTAFALAIAVAALTAPVVAAIAATPDTIAPRVLADTPGCESSGEPGDASLDCAPQEIPNVGAPSEMELTDSNPGIGGPHHRG
jgi:hypothetical protein